MKVCFIADLGSPIAKSWISYFVQKKYDLVLISSYPCQETDFPNIKVYQVPSFFTQFSKFTRTNTSENINNSTNWKTALKANLSKLRHGALSSTILSLQQWLPPLELYKHVDRVSRILKKESPDLVHAMRIPFEGILAAKAIPPSIPLIISVWGNDFTLFASQNPLIASQTKAALKRANALHSDCYRDLLLSYKWGFDKNKFSKVIPGAGGIKSSIFYPATPCLNLKKELNIDPQFQVVINPRGFRSYVRNDVFFQAIPYIIKEKPQTMFLSVAMKGHPIAEQFVSQLAISKNTRLLPTVSHNEMADLFRLADIAISPSLHDGTPNTLLEAMACGCFPVAGDIESLREWISNKVNGILFETTSPKSLAGAVLEGLENSQLVKNAKEYNYKLIAEKANFEKVMLEAENFYNQVIKG